VFPAAKAVGAFLHSNSWGSMSSYCNSWCTDVDSYLEDNPDFLIFFAAGNHGDAASTVAVPAMAKNSVAVGGTGAGHSSSSYSINHVPSWSSRGPTNDGRLGVDVVAPAGYLISAKYVASNTEQSCSVTAMYGTSMATPVVAGAAALVQQYFSNSSYWAKNCQKMYSYCKVFFPSGSLTKAVLIHSGKNIGDGAYSWPGAVQGFGRISLDSVLYFPGVTKTFDLFVDDLVITSYQIVLYKVRVTTATVPLKVTLAWIDPANVASASKQLLHDLDLKVYDASRTLVFYGNGNAVADTVNNVEMVYIDALDLIVGGYYSVEVSAGTLIGNKKKEQLFSLVITVGGYVTRNSSDDRLYTPPPTLTESKTKQNKTSFTESKLNFIDDWISVFFVENFILIGSILFVIMIILLCKKCFALW